MTGERAVAYGSRVLRYELRFARRRTLGLTVRPDGTVVVRAPSGTAPEEADARVLGKASWIARQLERFDRLRPATPPRRYVGGETHLYLGRQYRLRVSEGDDGTRLVAGRFEVTSRAPQDPAHTARLLEDWYRRKARQRFAERLDATFPPFARLGHARPKLQVRRARDRWGSMSAAGLLVLNTRLVQAPLACVDHVVVHELCHLEHPHHGPRFWALLERLQPDWRERKEWLERALA